MRRFAAIALCVSCVCFYSAAFAQPIEKPKFSWTQFFRFDMRHSEHHHYVNRLAAAFKLKDKQDQEIARITPFFEARRNIDRDIWSRLELGVEVGKNILPFFYLGEGIHAAWLKEDYRLYTHRQRRETAEAETRMLVWHDLINNEKLHLVGFLLDEFTYDFDIGAGTRNEIAIGVSMPVNDYLGVELDWRHLDPVHDFDSDLIEARATLSF